MKKKYSFSCYTEDTRDFINNTILLEQYQDMQQAGKNRKKHKSTKGGRHVQKIMAFMSGQLCVTSAEMVSDFRTEVLRPTGTSRQCR